MNKNTDFNYGPSQAEFMREVQRALVQQPDYIGMGGHGLEDHGGHGPHSQASIGMGSRTINFRELQGND
jgi:hypothetical protein